MARKEKSSSSGVGVVRGTFQQTFQVLKEKPTIWLLFLMIAILDAFALIAMFLSHSKPFSNLLGPLIRTFYGERFLHYPQNFVLLPKTFGHAHFLILSLFGIIVTGIVIKKIEGFTRNKTVHTLEAAGPVSRKYVKLLAAWIFSWFTFKMISDFALPLFGASLAIQIAAGFTVAVLVQAVFAFVIPEILIQDCGLFRGLKGGVSLGIKNMVALIMVIAMPVLILVGIAMLKAFAPLFVEIYPESVLWILGGSILITMVVDLFITASTTVLYLKVRK